MVVSKLFYLLSESTLKYHSMSLSSLHLLITLIWKLLGVVRKQSESWSLPHLISYPLVAQSIIHVSLVDTGNDFQRLVQGDP